MIDTDGDKNPVWELRLGEEVVATIEVTEQDFPWNFGHISSGALFEELRHRFRVYSNPEEARQAREELRAEQVSLSPQGGSPVREFTLIVEGNHARFRFV